MQALDKIVELVDAIDASSTPAGPRNASIRSAQPIQPWTMAQAVAHCAQSIEYSMAGYPKLRSGLFRATIGPLVKRRFIKANRMSHDPGAPIAGAPAIPHDLALDDARARLRTAVAAFRSHGSPLQPHLAYGVCTKDEYAVLHLLHVEDHLRR